MNQALSIVVEEFNPSGGLRILTAIANAASQAGCDVTVYCPEYSAVPFFPVDASVKICALQTGRLWRRLRYILAVAHERFCSPNIFFTSSYRLLNVIALIGLARRRPRPLFLIQGVDRVSLVKLASTPLIGRLVNGWLLSLSQIMPCDRLYVSEFLRGTLHRQGRVIPNFVAPIFLESPFRAQSSSPARVRIGFVGSSGFNKGFALLLEAREALMASGAACYSGILEFVCATQDRELVRQFGRSGIEFMSPQSDVEMRDFYESCDIFLSLSLSEGFGLPALEAMACGCAVICSNSGGVTDFLRHEENGLLLPDRSVAAIISSVKRLIEDGSLRSRIAEAAQVTARQFSYARFVEGYRALFHDQGLLS